MTSNLSKKLEFAANAANVLVAFFIRFVVVREYFLAADEAPALIR